MRTFLRIHAHSYTIVQFLHESDLYILEIHKCKAIFNIGIFTKKNLKDDP